MSTEVLLITPDDTPIGLFDKLTAHRQNRLHRAFSVFIFNRAGQLLLQRRAAGKYHSGGLWTNTCCGHPLPPASTRESAQVRLAQEMGLTAELAFLFKFRYQLTLPGGLHEHEWDYVYVGLSDAQPVLNPDEADDCRWIDWATLLTELNGQPEVFTGWLHRILDHPDIHDFVIELTSL
jgi:isopentenyl-diphosphate Delta-isomerase